MGYLSGAQFKELHKALLSAFPVQTDLALMYQVTFEQPLSVVTVASSLSAQAFHLIEWAEAHYQTLKLIDAARTANPTNEELFECASWFGIAPKTGRLERMIEASNPSVEISQWRRLEGMRELPICKIRVPTKGVGTGFLVGPDVLITNYHVVESVILGQVNPDTVRFRFDYKRADNGETINKGKEVRLVERNWLLDSSPYSPRDLNAHVDENPDPEHLDYALLRVTDRPGEDALGTATQTVIRGWLNPSDDYDFPQTSPIIIMQHPQGKSLQIAGGVFRGFNSNNTRVTYKTTTQPGSSGSPCFDFHWNLVALHHSGDPEEPFHKAEYNQGIPFRAILARMDQCNTRQYLGTMSS